MVADSQPIADSQAADVETTDVEVTEVRSRVRSDVGFDAKLAPTCMVWSMVVGLGFLISTMIIWGVQNFGTLFK